MKAAVAFGQAAFLTRPLRRPPRPYHAAGAEDGVAAGRGGVSLPRPRRARCSASLSVGAGGYGGACCLEERRDDILSTRGLEAFNVGTCKEDGCYMGEERLKRGWVLHGLKNRQHQDTKHGIPTSFLVFIIDASEEEIRSAKNFLLQQYAGYEESEEAIEGAYDKIIMKSYSHRKKSRINLKSKLKKQVEESPSWVKALLGYFEVPSMDVISRRSLFGRIAGWSIVTSAETGPTFQLALSLISCIYFLNDKMKSLVRVSTTGLGVFASGWIVGSLLVPVIPTFAVPPTWSLELLRVRLVGRMRLNRMGWYR